MSNPTNVLDKPFEDALSRAAALDRQGIPPGDPGDTGDLFPGRTPSNVELVQACVDFYHENQTAMDRAVQHVLDFLDSPDGVAYVKALEGSFESAEPNPLSVELASEILQRGDFGLATSHPQGLRGFGIGVSAGVSAFVGLLAGADGVFDFQDETQVYGRTWAGASVKGGLSISAGLELSFWVDQPLTGLIGGWLIDLYVPTAAVILLFIRFMYIKQRPTGLKEFVFTGVSLQFPLGIGLPIRRKKGKDGVTALFLAKQTAKARTRRETLQVVNQATGVSTIAVQETATLEVTLTNTSGSGVGLSAGATMSINMPSYFEDTDVGAMNIDYPGWTFTDDAGTLTLTLSKDSTWDAGADISFAITNVKSSNLPLAGQQSSPGTVKVRMSDASFDADIVDAAEFDLVWANSQATLDWQANVTTDFNLLGDRAGSIVAYAQPGNNIMTLTTAVDSSGTVWVLGYMFNYNTAITDQVIPQVTAAWTEQDAVRKPGKNTWYGPAADQSGQTSTCYYAGTSQSKSSIAVTPTFG